LQNPPIIYTHPVLLRANVLEISLSFINGMLLDSCYLLVV
jgi:hypothetical protein